MSFPRYPAYKESGVEWLGEVPAHWTTSRLKRRARVRYGIGEPPPYREVGTPLIRATNVNAGRIDRKGMVYVDPSDIPTGRAVWLTPGDILVVRSGAYTGDSALVRPEHLPALAGFDMVVRPDGCSPAFLQYALLSTYLKNAQVDLEKLRAAQPHLNAEELGACYFIQPPVEEQISIATFLDRETAKIDALIAEQERLIELLKEEFLSLVLESQSHYASKSLRLGETVEVMERPVIQQEGEEYEPLGLFNRGRGVFHKEIREMSEMGDSNFFWVEDGDLILSGQFAWEGAVALAGHNESRCVVSHRYAVLRGREGIALTEFLFALFLTDFGDMLLNESSRGAAGRNRPLNLRALLKEKIQVPDLPYQNEIAKRVHAWLALQKVTSEQTALLREFRAAVVSAAVTGQIDVRTASGCE